MFSRVSTAHSRGGALASDSLGCHQKCFPTQVQLDASHSLPSFAEDQRLHRPFDSHSHPAGLTATGAAHTRTRKDRTAIEQTSMSTMAQDRLRDMFPGRAKQIDQILRFMGKVSTHPLGYSHSCRWPSCLHVFRTTPDFSFADALALVTNTPITPHQWKFIRWKNRRGENHSRDYSWPPEPQSICLPRLC